MFIIIYRPHNELNAMTQYIGPYRSHIEASDALETIPVLGTYKYNQPIKNRGVRFIERLQTEYDPPYDPEEGL